jgi:hypothetical protein
MASWGTRLRHLGEEWLTGIPCPRRRSRSGGAHQHPAGEAAEDWGRQVGEVAGVLTVIGEALIESGNGQSDPSM